MYFYLCLLCCICGLRIAAAAVVLDATGRLNLSATCPDTFCSLTEKAVAYSDSPAVRLRELHISNCSREAVPWVVLNLTPGLRTLVIRNCGPYSIRKESLLPVRNLTSILMQRTKMWALRTDQFSVLPNLEILELGHNVLYQVNSDAFNGLTKLKLLGLQGNALEEIRENTFDPLVELVHLDLSGNLIEKLPKDIFAKNTKLETLLLNGNHLTTLLSDTLMPLTNLRLLDLGHAGQLDNLMLNIVSVQTLILEGSSLTDLIIHGGFIRLQASNNELSHLHVGNKSSVIEMNLHGNLLNGNDTYNLLRGMWSLERLDLSKNIIESLAFNEFYSEGQDLYLLPSLKYLNLANNRLVSLPSDSPILSSRLTFLDLSHNLLLTLDVEKLAGLPNVESLFLEGNRLSTFDYKKFHSKHETLKELALHDNHWSPGLYRIMFTYLNDRGVHLQSRIENKAQITSSQVDIDWPPKEASAQKLDAAGVTGIHPYWTLRDILAFTTLLVVLAILLMNLYHILEEEGCLRRFRRWRRSTVPGGNARTSTRRLNEQDSELQ
ncbi:uncharacterized protein Dana_GF18847, isoform C [Drosophila ananassae]|uniref:Uncharacterized protein, isoform C n=1 Tax=Drosophila ananassae TaxID=7217 RepID=A0A0P8YH39_DROAN|nr:uncharacterized protein Dana_GF18847, isoform C [Drosophila ananassae]